MEELRIAAKHCSEVCQFASFDRVRLARIVACGPLVVYTCNGLAADSAKPLFDISLAQWSLNKSLFANPQILR